MSHVLEQAPSRPTAPLPPRVYLELHVDDPDVISEVTRHREGAERERFALEALKIGVLALRRAATSMDAEMIQAETNRLLEKLRDHLDHHAQSSQQRMANCLKEHFDPQSGRFSERVKSLTDADGDLARLMRSQIDGDDSRLARTLLEHVGENSPLMKQLSPDQSHGLLATLRTNVEGQLGQQRERLLKEFSLDNPQGALSRLVRELTAKHGDLSKDLQAKIDVVVKEFSLDEENSALSRLVQNVDRAQRTITSEFSLDNETSALRRLKNELTAMLQMQVKTNVEFQEEVKIALAKLVTKREEELRSTRHGGTFQDALLALLEHDAQRRGDVVEDTGNHTGRIKNCKVGDAVIELGAEHSAAGARIVVEAKQDASYDLKSALQEIERARKNRDAQLGVFVFSRRTAPVQLESLARFGPDLIVVWDAENPQTDVHMKAALEIARALCVRSQRTSQRESVDFGPIDKAILDIEKRVQNLEQIRKSADTIRSSSNKILNRVDLDQAALEKQLEILQLSLHAVRRAVCNADDGESR